MMVSADAGSMTRLSQEDAFRFARGEEVTTTHGLRAKLSRLLDWLVVSDHAEMYGLMPQLLSGDAQVPATDQGRAWYEALTAGNPQRAFDTAMEIVGSPFGPRTADRQPQRDQARLGRVHGARRPLQCARRVLGDHRLRIHHRVCQQPAPQRPVPRRFYPGEPDPPLLSYQPALIMSHGPIPASRWS